MNIQAEIEKNRGELAAIEADLNARIEVLSEDAGFIETCRVKSWLTHDRKRVTWKPGTSLPSFEAISVPPGWPPGTTPKGEVGMVLAPLRNRVKTRQPAADDSPALAAFRKALAPKCTV